MKIRKIKKSDEKEVVKLLNEYDKYEYKLDKRHKPDSIKERKDFFNLLIKNKTAIGLVLEVDSKIAGFISGEERETLESYVKEQGMNNINFMGMKTNNETLELLNTSDCLILPSLHDGWGYVVNEVLAAGCRVISSDACGASRVVKEIENSFIFSSQDYKSLKKFMKINILNGPVSKNERKINKMKFDKYLSGDAGAKIIIKCIN